MNQDQVWKKVRVTKFTEYYVSDQGMCRSVRKRDGRTLESEGFYNKHLGYFQFARSFVHRLVALAFVYKPEGYDFVDHLNNDPLDNRAQNLAWTTRKANNSKDHARRLKRLRASSQNHDGQIIKATKDGKTRFFKTGYEAAEAFGCSHVLIYNALNKAVSARRAKGWTLTWVPIAEAGEEVSE